MNEEQLWILHRREKELCLTTGGSFIFLRWLVDNLLKLKKNKNI